MMAAALVLPDTMVGMIDPSAMRRPCSPRTFSFSSTTAAASLPMRQVPVGWKMVMPVSRTNLSMSASERIVASGR